MRTPTPHYLTEVIYNPKTDMYELYSFGVRVRRSPDAKLVENTAYYIERAYRQGKDDTLQILNNGEATLEELNETSRMMRVLKSSADPAFEEHHLDVEHGKKYVDFPLPDFTDESAF